MKKMKNFFYLCSNKKFNISALSNAKIKFKKTEMDSLKLPEKLCFLKKFTKKFEENKNKLIFLTKFEIIKNYIKKATN